MPTVYMFAIVYVGWHLWPVNMEAVVAILFTEFKKYCKRYMNKDYSNTSVQSLLSLWCDSIHHFMTMVLPHSAEVVCCSNLLESISLVDLRNFANVIFVKCVLTLRQLKRKWNDTNLRVTTSIDLKMYILICLYLYILYISSLLILLHPINQIVVIEKTNKVCL